MRVVTRRTGLSADLLRAWERRHDVVTPSRSENGRRLYSDADIDRLDLLYRATLAGRSIGHVAGLSTAQLEALVRRDADAERSVSDGAHRPPPAERRPDHHRPDYLSECVRAVERMDTVALDTSLRRAVVALSVEALLNELVVPLLERVGSRWRDGTLRPMHGHLASVVLRRVLDRVVEAATPAPPAPNLLVATPTGQLHELGAMLAAATAAAEGWRVTYLGAGLPAEDIGAAAEQTRARAVALSIVYPASDPALGHELRRLAALLPKSVKLVVGGAAASSYRSVLDEIGALPLGDLAALPAELRRLRPGKRRAR